MAGYSLFTTNQFTLASKLNRLVPQMITQGTDLTFTLNSTTPQITDIVFLPDLNAIYNYELFITYTASTAADFAWSWDASEATVSRFTLHRAPGAASGLNTGGTAVIRRPGQTTHTVIAQGLDPSGTVDPVNFCSAYDRGTFTTTGNRAVIALMGSQGTADADENTILRGGNGTRLLFTRVG